MAGKLSRLEGFREASKALNDMSKAAAQGVGRRALQVPAEMLASEMRVRAPKLTGTLEQSIAVNRERARKGQPHVNVTAADIAAIQNEFGNSDMAAQPFARPSVDAKKGEMLDSFGDALKSEVDRTLIRQAKAAARKAAKG